jgi:hypothetical protein
MGYNVRITWIDGKEETFFSTDYPIQKNGDLHITELSGVVRGTLRDRHFPTSSIRVWEVEQL